jgi:hypothetical protein
MLMSLGQHFQKTGVLSSMKETIESSLRNVK